MADLEATLTELTGLVAWPETPDLRPGVRRAALSRRPWFESRWALVAVAVIAIAAILIAYAPTRTAIADWVDLHTRITHTNTLPALSPRPSGPIGQRLGLGNATTLADARQGVTWPVLVPSSLGQPSEVYLQTVNGPSGGEVTLVYGSETGIRVAGATGASVLVTEARGSVNEVFFGKITADGTTVTPVTVAGSQGWWISGTPHVFFFTDENGDVISETMRLATNTLVLVVGGTVVRIEGDLTEQQAFQIAQSLS